MFTPSIQYQTSIQNIQAKINQEIKGVNSKDLAILNKTVGTIKSICEEILFILSSHDLNQPDTFSPIEKLKLTVLDTRVTQYMELFENLLSKNSNEVKFL